MTTYSAQCENCSTDFETIEAAEPGICGGLTGPIVKAWSIQDVTETDQNSKKRMLQLTGDHFDLIDGGDNSSKISLTTEMITGTFNFEFNEGSVTSVNFFTGQLFEIQFDKFYNDMQLTITLKNATLKEDYYTPTSSTPVKVLLPNSFTIPVANITNFSPEVIASVETTGKAVGQAQSVAEKSGATLAIIGIMLNIRFSGPLVKAIQIIVLFDKLRLINVKFDGLIGYFLEKVFKAFDSNIVSKDDYVLTAKPTFNKF